jgi:glycine cleavage system H protein
MGRKSRLGFHIARAEANPGCVGGWIAVAQNSVAFPGSRGQEFAPRNMSSKVPADMRYAKSHEWVRVTGNLAVVGITDHAQQELTDVVFVELPAVGRKVKAGEACAVVESVKTASDIYSPLSGEVLETNKAVVDNPALVNTDPYGAGWFYKIRLSVPAEANNLLGAADYAKQIGQ